MLAGFVLSEGEGVGLVPRTYRPHVSQLVAPGHSLAGVACPEDGDVVPHQLTFLLLVHVLHEAPDQ